MSKLNLLIAFFLIFVSPYFIFADTEYSFGDIPEEVLITEVFPRLGRKRLQEIGSTSHSVGRITRALIGQRRDLPLIISPKRMWPSPSSSAPTQSSFWPLTIAPTKIFSAIKQLIAPVNPTPPQVLTNQPWKKLSAFERKQKVETLRKMISRSKFVKFERVEDLPIDELFQSPFSLDHLEELHLSAGGRKESTQAIAEILRRGITPGSKTRIYLDLSRFTCSWACFRGLSPAEDKHLRNLSESLEPYVSQIDGFVSELSDNYLGDEIALILRLSLLKELTLYIDPSGAPIQWSSVSHLPFQKLEKLHWIDSDFRYPDFRSLDLPDLKDLSDLQELRFDSISLSQQAFEVLAQGHPSVKILAFDWIDLPKGFLENLKNFQSLTRISLKDVDLSDQDLTWISKHPTLQEVELSDRIYSKHEGKLRDLPWK